MKPIPVFIDILKAHPQVRKVAEPEGLSELENHLALGLAGRCLVIRVLLGLEKVPVFVQEGFGQLLQLSLKLLQSPVLLLLLARQPWLVIVGVQVHPVIHDHLHGLLR